MKANSNLTLHGERLTLVPYRKEHVLQYHEWMVGWFDKASIAQIIQYETYTGIYS
jgi:hypothetical protein